MNGHSVVMRWGSCVCLCLVACASHAQEPKLELRPLRKIRVPLDELEQRVPARWKAISASELQRLTAAAKGTAPPQSEIVSAEYSATIVADVIRGGTFQTRISRMGDQPALLELEPLNLVFADLRWKEGTAYWGTTRNGNTALLVDRKLDTLTGKWNLQGSKAAHRVEFDLQIPRSTVSRLHLRVESHRHVECSSDVVAAAQPTSDPQWTLWTIELGRKTTCRITIRDVSEQARKQPTLLTERVASYVVRDEGISVKTDFQIDVRNRPVSQLILTVPAGLRVYSIMYGAETPLAWETVGNRTSRQSRKLRITLPDPLQGTLRRVRVSAVGKPLIGRAWNLPQMTIPGALFLNGQVQLEVSRPLEIHAIQSSGCYQSDAVMSATNHETLTFQQYLRRSKITATIGYPRTEISATATSLIDLRNNDWQSMSQVGWLAPTGTTYQVQCQVERGWEVTDVQTEPAFLLSKIVFWESVLQKDRSSLLTIEFANALSADRKQTVLVSARRIAGFAARELKLPILEPIGCRRLQSVVSMMGLAAKDSLSANGYGGFREVSAELLPDFAKDSVVLNDADPEVSLHLTSNAAQMARPIRLPTGAAILSAEAELDVGVSADVIDEQIRIVVKPHGESLERVRVYFPNGDGELEWHLADNPIRAQKLAVSTHESFDLPVIGELWELQLPAPHLRQFAIRATRSRQLSSLTSVGLPFVPQTQSFTAKVHVKERVGAQVDYQTRQLTQTALSAISEDGPELEQEWSYADQEASLLLRKRLNSPGPLLASLQLRSQILVDDGGRDLHWAEFSLKNTRGGEFRFTLQSGAELIETRVNGIAVRPTISGEAHTLSGLTLQKDNVVEIRYWTPSQGAILRSQRHIVIPNSNYSIIDFDWQFALPRNVHAVGRIPGLQMVTEKPGITLTQRLFGPLGRSRTASMLHPFNADSWRAAILPKTSQTTIGNPAWGVGAEDWGVWHAVADVQPHELILVTTDVSQLRLCSWIVLLSSLVIGICLRLLRVPGKRTIATLGLSLCLAGLIALPEYESIVAGGGFAGWLIALLLPSQLLRRLSTDTTASESTQLLSTISLARTASSLGALLWLLALASSTVAQAPFDEPDSPSPYDVFVPESDQTDWQIAFINEEFLSALQAADRSRSAEYLICKSRYACKVRGASATVESRFQVAVISQADTVLVHLPIADAHLGGPDACRVNGASHTILPADDEPGFVLELARRTTANSIAPRKLTEGSDASLPGRPAKYDYTIPFRPIEVFDVELTLFPPTEPRPGGGQLDFQIPPVVDSQATVEFDREYSSILLPGIPESADKPKNAAGHHVAALGKVDRLFLHWSNQDTQIAEVTRASAQNKTVVIAAPTALEFHHSISCKPVQGVLESFELQFPARIEQVEVASETPHRSNVRPGARSTIVLIELETPQAKPITLELSYLIPVRKPDLTVQFLAEDPFRADSRLELSSNLIGVSSLPAFDVRRLEVTDDSLTPLEEGISVGDSRADLAYQIQKPSMLTLQLIPKTPRRDVFLNLQGVVRKDHTDWTFSAEVKTGSTPAFSHQLEVADDLRIESISVQEDGAERLVRWTNNGKVLTLFLSGRTTGLQNVEVIARQPAALGTALVIPQFRFRDAEVAESRLSLWHERQLNAELMGPDGLQADAAPPPESELDAEWLGSWSIADIDATQLKVKTQRQGKRHTFDVLFVLAQSKGVHCSLEARLHFQPNSTWPRSVKIDLPGSLSGKIALDATAAQVELVTAPNGSRSLVASLHPRADQPAVISLTTKIAVPFGSEWNWPQFQVQGSSPRECYAVVQNDGMGWTGTGDSEAPLLRSQLPLWVRDAAALQRLQDNWDAYRLQHAGDTLRRNVPEVTTTGGTNVALVETEIWVRDAASVTGRTTVYPLPFSNSPDITLNWPTAAHLRSILIDGVPLPEVEPHDEQLRLEIRQPDSPASIIQVYWEFHSNPNTLYIADSLDFSCPSLAGDALSRPLYRIIQSGPYSCRLRDGAEITAEVPLLLERAAALLQSCQQQAEQGTLERASWDLLLAAERAVAAAMPAESAEQRSAWSKGLQQLQSDLSKLEPLFEELPPRDHSIAALLPVNSGSRILWAAADPATEPSSTEIPVLRVWVFNNVQLLQFAALVGFPIACIVFGGMARKRLFSKLHRHAALSWFLIGTLWWWCLTPSILGCVLILIGFGHLLRPRRKRTLELMSSSAG